MKDTLGDVLLDAIVEALEEAVGGGLISEAQAGRLRALYIRILREKIKNIL